MGGKRPKVRVRLLKGVTKKHDFMVVENVGLFIYTAQTGLPHFDYAAVMGN